MRINYPDAIVKELEEVADYLEFDPQKMENVVRKDAPAGTQEKYAAIRKEMAEFRRQHFGFRD